MGLKGVKLAGAAGAAEGAITGATNSDSWSDLPQNILTGSMLGTVSGATGQKVLDSIIKPSSTKAATFGMKGGMENIINNLQAQNLVESGIKQSNELAKQALRQIPQVSDRLNTQTADFMQQSLNHKINLPQTIASQRAKTQQYVNQHAADEVIDFSPTKEQLLNYEPESSFKPNNYTKQDAESILRNRSYKQKLQIYNDGVSGENAGVNHFLGSDRRPFIRTLNNTLDNPDVKFTWEGKQHYSKKYTNKDNSHNFMDLVVTKDGKIFNKFPTNEKFIRNKISGAQDLSLKAPLSNTFKPINGVLDSDRIPYQRAVVNPKLPNISEVYQGLSEEAVQNMQNAVSTGLNKTSQKAGSLESIYQIKNELDRLSPQSPAVSEAKDKFAQTYAQAMQGHDKAFNLEQAHRLGLSNNTNSVSTMSPLEKNAFTQGLFECIGQNNQPNQNMADLALNYRSELSQVLTPNKLSQLEQNLQQNSNLFNRLTQIGKVAENKLNHQEVSDLSSAFARATKTLNDKMRGKMLKNSAKNLLNPNFEGKEDNWLLEAYPKTGGFFPTQYYFDKE